MGTIFLLDLGLVVALTGPVPVGAVVTGSRASMNSSRHVSSTTTTTSPTATPTATTTAPTTTSTTSATTTTTKATGTSSATTSTTTTVPGPSDDCGGQPTLVADGVTWNCTFDAEFTATSYDPAQWQAITTASSGYTSGDTACFVDDPANISVGDGYLSLTALKAAQPFVCQDPAGSFTTQYTSGYLSTYQLFSQTYGRFEVRAKVPASAVAGLQSSLWLYPESLTGYGQWPASGEIDMAETYSEYPGLAVPYIHYNYDSSTVNTSTDTNVVTDDSCTIDVNAFNDYVLVWTPGTMQMIYNGTTCLVDHWQAASPESGLEPFDQPFFINLTQALGIGTNAFDPSTTSLPATTEIQYVRVWQQGA